ncbi:DUF3383 domain-containing protein [Variovorax sp. NFACC27]|uniref:DUF3383 domain-containing protein n=1 Tax=unclassified Variovorax TaxID=663243 RepID=UPI00089A6AA3|nr:Protein of unknown function [Variovorax sp. NFACC28]SEG89696.1 Protein of unknown function [Variovorax sp. NFACC29]SFD40081.1 Protein of unknown function [Variovorax sp. NFACC26]SFG42376.1 Protein of unknown function [Variovorax sp. NFACC27]
MTIPADQIVKVNPGVLAAAGSAVDLNGLILTNSTYPPIGAVVPFALAADVGAYFGNQSVEKQMADIYFAGVTNGTKTPGLLYFVQYPVASVAAYLRGGSLASMTLTQLKALTGSLTIVADGVSKTAASISLSAATSFSNAATIIQAAFTTPGFTVTYDSMRSAFVVTSSTTGVTSTMAIATGTIAAGLALTTQTGAVLSQGAVAGVPATNMEAVVAATINWASFTTTWEPVTADKTAFSIWANSKGPRFAYVGWDTDVNAKVQGNTTTWGYYLQANQVESSVPVYGDQTHAAFAMAWAASLDFDRLNGRSTLAFKAQGGLIAYVTNASDAVALKANGYNFYGAYATAKDNFVFMYAGAISGTWTWADTFFNQIWLNANLQLAMIRLLLSVGSIPYNTQGYSLVNAACLDPINAGVNFGAIRTGVALSESQKAQIQNALGFDASPAIFAKGYVLQIVPATAAIRVERASPSMTLYYADGGSIQQLTLASISIQ